MSADDRMSDIDPGSYGALPHGNDAERRRVRRLLGGNKGLIVIYPLSAHAKASAVPRQGSPTRVDMPAAQPQLGFAIFFPHVNDEEGREGTYVSVRRNWDVPESVEDQIPIDTEEDHD